MADIIHVKEFGARKDVKALRTELRKSPKSAQLHFQLGRELLRVYTPANMKKGISHLEKAITLEPDYAEAYQLLANEIMEEKPAKGGRYAKKAAALYRAAGNEETADAILEHTAMHYVYEGWERLKYDLRREALKEAERALKIYPDCIDALNVYGSVYLERFEFAKAEETYQKAICIAVKKQGGKERIKDYPYYIDLKSRPYMRARHGLGLAHIYLGRFEEALSQFKLMLKMNPNDNQGVRFLLGDVCLFMDDIKRAEKYYKEYGGENRALIKLIKGDKTSAKRELEAMGNENEFMLYLLFYYLSDYRVSSYINVPDDDPVKIFTHPKYKYLLITLKRYFSHEEMDHLKYHQFREAFDFCKLYGPLWVSYETYDFVEEVFVKCCQR